MGQQERGGKDEGIRKAEGVGVGLLAQQVLHWDYISGCGQRTPSVNCPTKQV